MSLRRLHFSLVWSAPFSLSSLIFKPPLNLNLRPNSNTRPSEKQRFDREARGRSPPASPQGAPFFRAVGNAGGLVVRITVLVLQNGNVFSVNLNGSYFERRF